MKIGELFVRLGVTADTFTVRDFTRAVGDIPIAVAGAITGLTGLSVGFLELTKRTLDIANNLGLFRAETGLSINELQRWTGVAKQVGISTDVVQASILRLSQAVAGFRTGHGDPNFLMALGQLGVPIQGNAYEMLEAIGRATKGRNAAVSSDLLTRMGIDPAMMRIFSLPAGDFSRMAGRGQVMNEGELRAMQDFQEALGHFEITIEKSFIPVITAVEPYMKDLADALGAFILFAGSSARGIGGLTRFFKEIGSQGGVGNFLNNLSNSLLTPEMLHNKAYVKNEFNTTVHVESNADDNQVVAEIVGHHITRHMTKAMKQFGNSGH